MDVPRSDRWLWTSTLFLFALVHGIGKQMRGALLPTFQETFSVSAGLLGLVAPAGTAGVALALLLAGMSMGRINVKRFLSIGAGVTAVSMVFMGLSVSYYVFLGFLVCRSVGTGIFQGLDQPVLGHLHPERRGRIFNLRGMVWAVGATAGPLFVNVALALGNWRTGYLTLGVGMFAVAVLVWRLNLPLAVTNERPLSRSDLELILGRKPLVLVLVALFLVGGVEAGMFTWLPFYMTQFYSKSTSNLVLSSFLVAYIPGRYIYGLLSGRTNYATLLYSCSMLLVLALVAAFTFTTGVWTLLSVFAVGLLVSGMYPTMAAFGTDSVPEYSGPMVGLATSSILAGSSIFPVLMGITADYAGIDLAMKLMIGFAIGVTVLMFASLRSGG